MFKTKEVICRNPKCLTGTKVYLKQSEPLPLTGFYVIVCPKCGKQVPFPPGGMQKVDSIPDGAVLAKDLE
jgi:hypothetical protein